MDQSRPPPALTRSITGHLFDSTKEDIGILVYSGYFLLVHDPGIVAMLGSKAEAGVRVRIPPR